MELNRAGKRVQETVMNVHAAALAKAHRFDEQTTAFAGDVIDDLSQHPKRLSPKYFYDAAGSELFEQLRARGVVEIFWRQPFGVLR